MSIRNLEHLFRPASVAVIGASDRPGSVGATVMRNLLAGGFAGRILPVNRRHAVVGGLKAVPDVEALGQTPELAVICTPPATVPGIVRSLGHHGTKAAVVLSAGLARESDARGRSFQELMLEEARPHLLRILGPNSVGLLVPTLGLNASFAHTGARPGRLAFVSQSGALTTAMLDWAQSRSIGFSHFVSLGDAADVDFGDLLDYLANDAGTSAILLYIESVTHARKFMSAARAAARNKPVIAVKAGRTAAAAQAAASHTGALAGVDDVYDAALRRAGILRVNTTQELFDAAETLSRARPFTGDRLTILTNGGGPGVMAADALTLGGGKLATLSDPARAELERSLPSTWSHGNPVDIIGDASPERHARSLAALVDQPGAEPLLQIHAPTAIAPSEAVARACLPVAQRARRTVLTCWMGGESAQAARDLYAEAGLPVFETPEQAVDAFLQMARYQRNQALLIEVPSSLPVASRAGLAAAGTIIKAAHAAGRKMLDEAESKEALRACGIPVVATRAVPSVEAAVQAAGTFGFPVALKIHSPDISHKSDVGGVALNLQSAQAVRDAALQMQAAVAQRCPQARLQGFTVQPMVNRPDSRELIVGAKTDPTFGPVILFGTGGTSVEAIDDNAVALPPLNAVLARDLVSRTRISRVLAAHRGRPAANLDAICDLLVRIAQFIAEIPEVVELDLNPVLAGPGDVVVLDARIRVGAPAENGARLAIRPYPGELEGMLDLGGKALMVRPIRPEDEPRLAALIDGCRSEDRYLRFLGTVGAMAHSRLGRYTQIDYDREMSFVAVDGDDRVLGEVRANADPDNVNAEFAILVASEFQGHGLGRALLDKLIAYCRRRGTQRLFGDVLATNAHMLELAAECGFLQDSLPVDGVVRVTLVLNETAAEAAREAA